MWWWRPSSAQPLLPHVLENDWMRRTLTIDGQSTPYHQQLAWPGVATHPLAGHRGARRAHHPGVADRRAADRPLSRRPDDNRARPDAAGGRLTATACRESAFGRSRVRDPPTGEPTKPRPAASWADRFPGRSAACPRHPRRPQRRPQRPRAHHRPHCPARRPNRRRPRHQSWKITCNFIKISSKSILTLVIFKIFIKISY